jgi:hypothetical protein
MDPSFIGKQLLPFLCIEICFFGVYSSEPTHVNEIVLFPTYIHFILWTFISLNIPCKHKKCYSSTQLTVYRSSLNHFFLLAVYFVCSLLLTCIMLRWPFNTYIYSLRVNSSGLDRSKDGRHGPCLDLLTSLSSSFYFIVMWSTLSKRTLPLFYFWQFSGWRMVWKTGTCFSFISSVFVVIIHIGLWPMVVLLSFICIVHRI